MSQSLLPPGTSVSLRQTAPPRSAPTDTSVWFVSGFTVEGPTTPQVIQSIQQFAQVYGPRASWSILYDALDVFFKEGGSQAIVTRVIGPSPVLATVNLPDAVPTTSLIVKAKWYGAYANGMKIVVAVSGTYTITVEDSGSNVLEISPALTTQADAVAWSQTTSQYVNITLGSSMVIPVAGTYTLASGTDDYTDATDTQWLNAISQFLKAMGPGQVSMPGRTTTSAHANLIAHAAVNNREALLDYTDVASRATLVAAAATDRAISGSQSGAAFASWLIAPGVVAGTTRTVPPSAGAAGLMARNDNAGISQNQPSAGILYGQLQYCLGLTQPPWSDVAGGDLYQLNHAGINVFLIIDGVVTLFGYRTLADPSNPANLILLSNARLVMEITAKALAIGLGYVFRQIDGQGLLFADFAGDLKGMLLPYFTEGSLFGATPADAFTVDTGPSVNTPLTISELQLNAVLSVTLSPDAEQVPIQIVTSTLTEGVI